jgi:lipoate-protein ligase A
MDVELEENSPDFPDLLKNPSGSLCFASTAKSEIKYLGKKLVGSAQRKFGSFILQHGSILIGTEHKELVNYLKVDPDKKESLLREMEQKTTELYTITGQNIDIYSLQDNIISGFEKVLKSRFIRETLETC